MVNNFNIARLLLALTVVNLHVFFIIENTYLFVIPNPLSCFIAISGYLVYKSYIRSSNTFDYFTKRVKRIIPALYLNLFVLFIVLFFVSKASNYFTYDTFKFFIDNALLLNLKTRSIPSVFSTFTDSNINGALWTISLECVFYALLPILLLFSKKHTKIAILSILSLLIFITFATICNHDIYVKIRTNYYAIMSLSLCVCFFVGMLLFLTKEKYEKYLLKFRKSSFIIWTLLTIVLFITSCYVYRVIYEEATDIQNMSDNIQQHRLILSWNFICMTILSPIWTVYFCLYFPWQFTLPKFMSDISYGVYLYHWPIIQITRGFFEEQVKSIWLIYIISFILTILCGLISYHLIEKRFMKKKV